MIEEYQEISSTDELFQTPVTALNFPVLTAIQALPYNNITDWKYFERLCLRLVQAIDGGETNDIQFYKKEGSKQDGIDICKVYRSEGVFDVYQCKKYKTLTKTNINKAIAEVKKNKFWGKIRKFYICTSADLSVYDDVINDLKIELQKEGIDFGVWDSKRLDILLKEQPQLVFEFFDGGQEPNFIKHFCGLDKVQNLFYNIKKIEYTSVKNYIPRKLLKRNEVELYKQDEINNSLIQLFENKQKPLRISILSTAGDGKTSELKQLASHFSALSSPDSLFPILIRLKDYVDDDLPNLLKQYCPDWEKIKPERLLIVLDGYDEVKDTIKEDLNRRISRLADTNPTINIVVSSRNNGVDRDIDQFETYFLQKLSLYGEVRDYIWDKMGFETETFIHLMFQNKMNDLLLTPFYLVQLTQLYLESPEDFPANRNEVFDKIIALINNRETSSTTNRISKSDWEDIEDAQNALLGKAATIMLLMGKNIFDSKEYKATISKKEDRIILEKSPLFNKNYGKVEFTHNLFQEYLTAKLLSKQSFDTIKKCISFEPDFVKIKPKWTNTLSSLFSLLPKDSDEFKDLLTFIMKSDHSLLIRFEHDKVSLDERFTIFKEILESTDRDYRNYSHGELIKFAGIYENENVIKYLLENINPQNQKQTRELTYLLKFAKPEYLFGLEKEIEAVLKTILSDKNYDDEIHEDVLWTFSHLKLSNPELIEWLMIHRPSFELKNVLCVVFELINNLDIVDKHIDFYLDSIPICNKELVKNGSIRGTGVRSYFYAGIYKVKSTKSLHRILDYVINNHDELERRSKIFCEEDFKGAFADKLFAQLVKGYISDKTLFNKVAKFIEQKLDKSYNPEVFIKAKPFFEETKTTEKALWYFWDNKNNREMKWYIRSLFICWIDKPIIDKWVKRYKQKYYNDSDVYNLKFDLLRHKQQELLQYFLDEVNVNSEKPHDYPTYPKDDYQEIENERRDNDLEFLLNKPKFLEIVTKILELLGEGFSQESLRELEYKDKPFNCHLPFDYIEYYFINRDKPTDFTEIFEDINDEVKWTEYVLYELSQKLKNERESLPNEHYNYIKTWCYDVLPSLNFRTARWIENELIYTKWNEDTFSFFFQHLQLEVPQNVMLDMLSFDVHGLYDWKESEHHKIPPLSDIVIDRVKNDELIKQRVLENLDSGIEIADVLGNHFRLCKKFKIYEAKYHVLNAIKRDIFSSYYGKILVDIYVELKGEISDFDSKLDDFNPTREDHWYVLEKLSIKEKYKHKINEIVIKYLESNVDISENDRYRAMNQLILNNHIRGLVEFKQKYRNIVFDSYFSKSEWFKSLAKIPFEDSIEHWEEILQNALINNKNVDNFHRRELEGVVFSMFSIYALNNEDVFNQIRIIINKYIQNNEGNEVNFWYLKSKLKDFENEYYLNKVDIPTVAKAQAFCEEIGLVYEA